ncbi:MAG: T9SS type A sorting domain-containing protein [Bacteroidales bacterium]|nr:T9SS type A sorting domain-containing protein [Bacteroidales bacterium]
MKTKLFAILLLAMMSFLTTNAQTYQPIFGTNSTYFTTLFGGDDLLRVQKDTLVDGQVYKVFPRGDLVRVTSDNSKVYVRPTDPYYSYNQKEYLIMDLNMKLGDFFILNDSITYNSIYKSGTIDTLVVDSVYYLHGLKHIRFDRVMLYDFNWVGVDYKFEFIEGVGTTIGFNYRPAYYGAYFNDSPIICYFKDDAKFYSQDQIKWYISVDGCYSYPLGINEKRSENPIQITFDNHSNQLIIKSTNGEEPNCIVSLFNSTGTLLKRIDEVSFPSTVRLSNLNNGVYIVSIKTETSMLNRKIVVNR